jgi:hypothetical protein
MPAEPAIGDLLGDYRIESVLGRGGMGVVYVAADLRLGRRVALKVLAPSLSEDIKLVQRFVRESRMAAAIEHPNIIPIYDAGESNENFYIAMRVVDGADLGKVLRSEGPLDPSRALSLLRQVGSALDAAHARGLVHRDVKPANMLVSADTAEGAEHVYLTDFGLTKPTAGASGLTEVGQFVGTIAYVAPEQVRGDAVDARADVYSLGCVLFECLTGRPPFTGPTDVAVIMAHLNDDRPLVTAARPELGSGIDAVIAKALAKDPDERFATCLELIGAAATALLPMDRPTGVDAGRSTGTGADRRRGRGRGRRASVAPSAATEPVVSVLTAPLPAEPRDAAGLGQASPRRRRRRLLAGGIAAVVIVGGTIAAVLALGGGTQEVQSTLPKLMVMTVDGSDAHVVAGAVPNGGPTWNADSGSLAFAGRTKNGIFTVGLDGTNLTRVSPKSETGEHRNPAWSPDGRFIAYQVEIDQLFSVWVVPAGGGDAVMVSPKDLRAVNPTWSPDGKEIAFEVDRGNLLTELWIAEWDGVTPSHVAPIGGSDHPLVGQAPAWQPTRGSTAIAFERQSQIFLGDVSGSDPCPLTPPSTTTLSPSWTVDGRRVVFAKDVDGVAELTQVDGTCDGSHVESPLVAGRVTVGDSVAFSPDGRLVAFVQRARTFATSSASAS